MEKYTLCITLQDRLCITYQLVYLLPQLAFPVVSIQLKRRQTDKCQLKYSFESLGIQMGKI